MKTNWNLKENSEGELIVTINGQAWKDAQKQAFDKLASEVQVDGFRKGSVPAKIAKSKVNPSTVLMDAVDLVAQEALISGVGEHQLELISRPELSVNKLSEEEVELTFLIAIKPEVALGDYKGIEVVRESIEVLDEDIQAEISQIQKKLAELVLKEEGTLENGETAIIDFEGFLDNVAFEGGKGENFSLLIGSGQFIPGFEEQLIGMAPGEEKDINVTFPEEYQAENLAGKEVVFKVKLHEIKYESLPEMDDNLALESGIDGVSTMSELRAHLLEVVSQRKEQQAQEMFLDQLYTKVVESASVEIPSVMINDEVDFMLKDFEQRLSSQGLDLNGYLQFLQKTEEDVRNEMKEEATRRVKFRLVVEKIAEVEEVEVSEEEINAEIANIAAMYQMEVDTVKELLGDQQGVINELRARKALKVIEDNAK